MYIDHRSENQGQDAIKLRTMRLRAWESTVQRVVAFDVQRTGWFGDAALPRLYARVTVELAHLNETLDLDDGGGAERIAAVFDIMPHEAANLWREAADEARANATTMRAAADKRLTENRSATLGHRKMVDGLSLSAALRLTKARKQSIFPLPFAVIDGRRVNGKRFRPMLPTWVPPMPGRVTAETITAPIASWTLTLAERRALRERLGYKMATIAKAHREMNVTDFQAWVARREAMTWPAEKLSGRKEPGESDYHATLRLKAMAPKTRTRKPGIMAARRAFAQAFGMGLTKAKNVTRDMSEQRILEAIRVGNVTNSAPYLCHVRPDKKPENPLFHANLDRISDVQSATEKTGVRDTSQTIDERDMIALRDWYLGKKGKPLQKATIRKWRQRGMVDRMVFAACEHVMANTEVFPAAAVLHAAMRIRVYQDARRDKVQNERLAKLPLASNVVRIFG